jgi:hypothetical protein
MEKCNLRRMAVNSQMSVQSGVHFCPSCRIIASRKRIKKFEGHHERLMTFQQPQPNKRIHMIFNPPFDARLVEPWLGEYADKRRQAQQRGLPFTITENEYWQWITWITTTAQCFYGGGGAKNGIRLTMDRIDNRQGYHLWNIVPSCCHHNTVRSNNWTVEAFKDIVKHYPTPCRNSPYAPAQRLM